MGLRWLLALLLVIAFQECMSFSVGNSPKCPRVPPRISNRFLSHVVSPTRADLSFHPHDSSAISFRLASAHPRYTRGGDALPDVADRFAELVSKGFKQFDLKETANEIPFPPLPTDDFITKYSIKSSSTSIEAWVLPSSADRWILNRAHSKQHKSLFQNVLVRRMDCHSLLLEDETIKMLLEGAAPIWIGLPGIGKSVASTVILVKAMQSVIDHHKDNSKAGFEAVYYRVGKELFVFEYDEKKKRLSGREITGDEKIQALRWLETDMEDVPSKYALIVDMDEDEKDPKAFGFYTGSSRRAREETFKTLDKSTNARFYLMDPPSNEELRLMYLVLAHFVRPLPAHIDSLAKFEANREKVGPVPRVLFSADSFAVKLYVESRLAALQSPFADIVHHSVSNVGDHLKYFLAPFVRDRSCIARIPDNYEFRFLSDESKLMLSEKVELPSQMEFVVNYGRATDLLEVMMKYGGALKPKQTWTATVPPACQLKNWLWSSDPGMRVVTEKDNLKSSQIPEYELCEREILCADDALSIPVWELEERTLYQAATAKFPVVEWLFVNHTQKRVYGHQATVSRFSKHIFETSTVDNVLDRLKFQEPAGQDYKLVIIGVNDASLEEPNGLRFMHNKDVNSLSYFQQHKLWNNADRIETFLVRIPAFQKEAAVALSKEQPTVGVIVHHFLKGKRVVFIIEADGELSDISKTAATKCPNYKAYVKSTRLG